MEHLLSCSCGRKIPVSRSQAGQEITCECGQLLQVPTLRGFAQLPLAESETLTAGSTDRRPWGGWRGTIMAVSVAVFALSAIPCAYYSYIRSQIDVSYGIEDEIAAGNQAFDAMPLENMVADWSNLERVGLGPKDKPPFYYWKRYAREQDISAMVTGVIAAISAIMAIALWVTAPKARK